MGCADLAETARAASAKGMSKSASSNTKGRTFLACILYLQG